MQIPGGNTKENEPRTRKIQRRLASCRKRQRPRKSTQRVFACGTASWRADPSTCIAYQTADGTDGLFLVPRTHRLSTQVLVVTQERRVIIIPKKSGLVASLFDGAGGGWGGRSGLGLAVGSFGTRVARQGWGKEVEGRDGGRKVDKAVEGKKVGRKGRRHVTRQARPES